MQNNENKNDIICGFVNIIKSSIQSKIDRGLWNGGKCIAYLPLCTDVRDAVLIAQEIMSESAVYSAVDGADCFTDDKFVSDTADGTPRILFACERYREGSDIEGLEMTLILMGNTIGSHIILQVAGRALRNDYKGKEGWCVIARPSDEGTTEDDVLDSIVLKVMEFISTEITSVPTNEEVRQIITGFFGDFTINGKIYSVEETISRLQAMYIRKEYVRSMPKEKYSIIQNINRELGLHSKNEYEERRLEHLHYINDPKTYFSTSWVSWYHYLGVNTSSYPHTKKDWIRLCKNMGITSWEDYKSINSSELPQNPGEMYDNYTNWDLEFGVVTEEHVW
jgi:hypothetical protein